MLKVYISDMQNEKKVPNGIRLLIRKCCHAVLDHEKFVRHAEVSVSFIDDNEMRKLNYDFREKDITTDVLSFPLGENGVYDINADTGACLLGDIVISLPQAFRQAGMYGHSLRREIGFLVVHSMLHLLGHDHEAGGMRAVKMRESEEAILEKVGLSRSGSMLTKGSELI